VQLRPRATVLIVDDDPSTRFALSQSLEALGLRVMTADDGAEVLDMLAGEHFDLLVLDLYMPGMNGFEVMRQIRNPMPGLLPAPKTPPDIPVVVISGESDPDSVAHVKSLGAALYISKPIDLNRFEEAVKRVLRMRPTLDPKPTKKSTSKPLTH
jgi:CheY-like chemotaxis protein